MTDTKIVEQDTVVTSPTRNFGQEIYRPGGLYNVEAGSLFAYTASRAKLTQFGGVESDRP